MGGVANVVRKENTPRHACAVYRNTSREWCAGNGIAQKKTGSLPGSAAFIRHHAATTQPNPARRCSVIRYALCRKRSGMLWRRRPPALFTVLQPSAARQRPGAFHHVPACREELCGAAG